MTDEWARLASSSISHAADMVKASWQAAAWEQMRPCVVFKPTLTRDGNMWCALLGENLQVGVAGFGETPAEAMYDFDAAWNDKSGQRIIQEPSQ